MIQVPLLIVFLFAPLALSTDTFEPRPSVRLSLGQVVGLSKQVSGKRISVFFGVPYAQPPLGSLRFQAPQQINRFAADPYDADRFRPHCPQPPNSKFGNDTNFGEDCLHLNVFVPQTKLNRVNQNELICDRQSFAVLLYIFGGVGSYNQPMRYHTAQSNAYNLSYDGELLAANHDVITVVVNYRVTMLGHMYLPGQLPGNQALRDQQEAIRFVHRHVSKFCGDAERITLVGNSFGSMSIGMHLLSGQVSHLFRSVIMQSGSPLYRPNMPSTPDRNHRNSLLMSEEVGCLRSRSNDGRLTSADLRLLARLRRQAQEEEANYRLHPVNLLDNEPIQQRMRHLVSQLRTNLTSGSFDLGKPDELRHELTNKIVEELKPLLQQEMSKLNRLIELAIDRFEVDLQCLFRTPAIDLGKAGSDLFLFYFFDGDVIPVESIVDIELRRHISMPGGHIKSMLIGVNDDESCGELFPLAALKNASFHQPPPFTQQEMNDVFDKHPLVSKCKRID
jgi:carboxylesterase type B